MNASSPPSPHVAAPGTEKPRRFRPKLRYELIGCGLHGHEILGTDAAALRPEDELFARESGGLRWYRCLRCDSWLALTPPEHPARKYPPARAEIMLPLRGKPLRDRYVLRLIALDRMLHFLVLSALAAAVLLFARRWAEYLTFVATIVFIPYEIDELIKGITALKVLAFIINVAVAVYLLYAKRLFGVRGGGRAEKAEREADTGWTAIERATPKSTPQPRASGAAGGEAAEVVS